MKDYEYLETMYCKVFCSENKDMRAFLFRLQMMIFDMYLKYLTTETNRQTACLTFALSIKLPREM